ncbi:MAG: capsular polysaccharide synthesis protein [Desulfovibrio sp.]|jgi:hypothetical protein|nr:capsular polysaccharide synthesis protein [Desulfovibrio sp.]
MFHVEQNGQTHFSGRRLPALSRVMPKRIFTFWEPREKIPGYLTLCMQTWSKFLPDYEIVVLDYANLEQWLGKDCFDKSLYTNFPLPKQADAIRCAVLRRWGGVWFDTDTIVTSEKIRDLLRSDAEFTLLGTHIGFIVARKNAAILRIWEKNLQMKIRLYKYYKKYLWFSGRFPRFPLTRYMERWNFLGNSILKQPLFHANAHAFKSIDKSAVNAFPELGRYSERTGLEENYADFYFGDHPIDAAANNGGLICLHNSWTPERYKAMNAAEFLRQKNTLSNTLRGLLAQQTSCSTR